MTALLPDMPNQGATVHVASITHNGERGKERAWTYRCDCGEVDSCRLRVTTVAEHRRHAATAIGRRMASFAPLMDVDENVVRYMIGPVNRLAAFDPVSDKIPTNHDINVCREVIRCFANGDDWVW